MSELTTFVDFEAASRATLSFLHQRFGFDLWMMTRVEGSDCLVLQAENHGYKVEEGTVFRWGDSFCSQMVLGHGSRVVPNAQNVPLFATSPVAQQFPIGAYIGVPLASTDGSLFGTLCAIDPNPKDESIRDELPLIEFLTRLLGTILVAELRAAKQDRLLERSQQAARTDVLTGLLNRHGWEQSVATEEARAKRYGSPACVLIVDLDGLKQTNDTKGHVHGDALIRSASNSIRSALRENDIVARVGGDEFAILGIECDAEGCEAIFKNVTNALLSNGISASVGKALRDHRLGLFEAIAAADRDMYVEKAKRRMRYSKKNS